MVNEYRVIRLYLPGAARVSNINYITDMMDALYNSMHWKPAFPIGGDAMIGHQFGPLDVLIGFSAEKDPSVQAKTQNLVNRRVVEYFRNSPQPTSEALLLQSVVPVQSVEINLSGVGETVDAVAEVLDPLRRKQRKEQLRHDQAMNQVAEKSTNIDNQLKSLALAKGQFALLQSFVETGALTQDQANQAMRNLISAQDHAANEIESADVKVLQVTQDLPRE